MALDIGTFPLEKGNLLAALATESEFGNGPININNIAGNKKALIDFVLSLSQNELRINGISLYGPKGTFGIQLETNALGNPIYQ